MDYNTPIGKQMKRRHMDPAHLMVRLKEMGHEVHWRTIENWRKGEHRPQAATLPILAKALNCKVADLV